MSVAVIVSSDSGIAGEIAEKYNVRVVPLHVMWDGKQYADGIDITPAEFYPRLKAANTWPSTDSSVQGELCDMCEELKGKVDSIVIIMLSPNTPAAGYRSALMAKDMVEGIPVEVVDSQYTTVALGLIATAAGQAAAAGGSLEEVVKAAKNVIPKMNVFLNPGSISYFLHTGRVAESEVGSREDSYIISITGGKFTPIEKYATEEEARRRLRELVEEKARKDTALHVGVVQAAIREEAEEFQKWVESQYNCAELWIEEAPPVAAIHLSPESLGVAFYNE
jgi:DegV family protein with EDD domain